MATVTIAEYEVQCELARKYIGDEYDRLCEKYGEDVIVRAFLTSIDAMTVDARTKDVRRSLKRLRRKRRKWRKKS